MDIKQLRYFIAVAEKLSFSKAAASLFVTQSALSKQIMLLEEDLGVVLLQRNKQSVKLTEAGRYLLANAKELDKRVDDIRAAVIGVASAEKSYETLSVGITDMLLSTPAFAMAYLKTTEALKRQYGNLRVVLNETSMSRVKHDVLGHAIDLGVVVTEPTLHQDMNDINYRIFHAAQVYLISTKNSGLSLDASKQDIRRFLKEKDIYMYEERPRIHMQAYQICADLDARPKSISTLRNPRLLTKIALGEGVTFSRIGEYERYMRDELTFTRLPIESGKMVSLFAWNGTNAKINSFCSIFEQFVHELEEQEPPLLEKTASSPAL